MVYRGLHRKLHRARKIVIGTLMMLALVLTLFAPGAAQAKKGETYWNCGNYDYSATWDNDSAGVYKQHCIYGNSGD
jgi:hypothetical protein